MDLPRFCAQVLRRPLWDHQVEVAEASSFITVIAKARRTGGTVLAEAMAMHRAFSNRDCKVLILSATQDAARRVTESIGAQLATNDLTKGAVVDDFATRIRLRNGSQIISLPASQRQVRGYGEGVLLVILDEAGFMPSELWTAAQYVALDERANGSRILMLGTPWGGAEHFFRQSFLAGQYDEDPDHASFHWTYKVNPSLDHTYLERARERVSPVEYAAEVLGEWSDAVGALFPRELLERQTADIEVPALHELDGLARPIIGCDWGVSFDRSAQAVIYRLPVADLNEDAKARFVVFPYIWPQGAKLISDVVAGIAASPAPFAYIATETNGVGAGPSQELRERLGKREPGKQWLHVHTTSQTKTVGYGGILGLIDSEQLVLPRDPDLLRQLAGLRFEQGERGFTHIEAEHAAQHDDVADALMLAALPCNLGHRSKGMPPLMSYLGRLATPRIAPADAAVPSLDQEIVTTGAGLRVYRRPPLQSASGQALTLPSGVAQQQTKRVVDPSVAALKARVQSALSPSEREVTP